MQDSLFQIRMPAVNGARVKQARELNGLTQAALASAVYVDQTMIAHIERGTKQPTAELLETMSQILEMPPAFFRQQDSVEMSKGSLLFRSKAGVGKRVISQAYEQGRLALELALRLGEYARFMPVRIPAFADPLEAAQEIRRLMGIETGPVPDLFRHIERLGVLILPISDIRDCDAFATWAGPAREIPVIGLASGRPPDRVRLSTAHELGHLALHRSYTGASTENEEEAYLFAAELLMPAADISEDFTSEKLTLFRLAELKNKWLVSMQALARRARELQIINDRQYRYIMMQISQKGWRSEEPTFHNLLTERPRALRKLAEVAFGDELNYGRIASEFNLSNEFVSSILNRCEGASKLPNTVAKQVVRPSPSRVISFPPQK
jgi:Zn-dependent peptidase ImmA (M78 family)/DNA-binding XRE family transcriptional regulator